MMDLNNLEEPIRNLEQSLPKATNNVTPKTRSDADNEEFIVSSRRIVDEIKHLSHSCNPHVPNPAPLGLIAFGLTTALLQLKHTRLTGDAPEDLDGVDTVVMGFAMFFGGLLQVRILML